MKEIMKSKLFDEERAEQNMIDAGCSKTQVVCFCECMQQGKKKEELRILEKRRDELLQEIHTIKDSLEELDEAIQQLRSGIV